MTQIKYPPETYTPKEQQSLLEFRAKVSDLDLNSEQLQDSQLIRWLRARSLNSSKAYEMLKKHLEWRKEFQVDGILEREVIPQKVKDDSPFAMCGVDKDGYPILIFPFGRQDLRSRLEEYGTEECRRHHIFWCEMVLELLRDLSKEQERPVTQFVEIMDLECYSYRQLASKQTRDFYNSMQAEVDANYPELLRHALVINAPKFFYFFFNLMKPIIPKETLAKIDLQGPDPEKWKRAITERYPPELIPPHWGGSRAGKEEYCLDSDIWRYGNATAFFQKGTFDDSSLTSATINARDKLKVILEVGKPGCSIFWKFRTQEYDIGFEIVGEGKSVVYPYKRVQSQKLVQEGSQICGTLGKYTVVFDNSYSWTTEKKLWYSVSILDPEELEFTNGVEKN